MTTSTDTTASQTHLELTAEIVGAYVANNSVPTTELPALIAAIHTTLLAISTGHLTALAAEPTVEQPSAAQIRKSITPDGLISFLDGKSYKTLKRHLTGHGLTPDGYRRLYGLPADYPLVCATYSEQRSALAKALGLGTPGGLAPKSAKKATLKQAA